MPEDAKGSTGAAYKAENGKILIPIDVSKIEDINERHIAKYDER